MDFGIFLEQTRRGNDQDAAFREMFALVDAGEAWGLDIVWLPGMMIKPPASRRAAPDGELGRIAPQAPPRGDGRAAPPPEPSAARGRRGHRPRPPEPGAVRLRDRPQRLAARLRRPRRAVRGKPGTLLRSAGHH